MRSAGRNRRRWLVVLGLLALLVSLFLSRLRAPEPVTALPAPAANSLPAAAAGSGADPATATAAGGDQPTLRIGAYVTNISDIDLLEDRFSIELLLWTLWDGDPDTDPSDQLSVLNGIYDGDIQRFDPVRKQLLGSESWSLYRVRSQVVNRWQLHRYPFDQQVLHLEIGFDDPLLSVPIDVAGSNPMSISPGMHLPGWLLKESSAYATSISLMSDLGRPPKPDLPVRRQPTISYDISIERRSVLYLAPDFLGYMLAVGLCSLSLMISRSRDDLILAAVVSAASNYVFIAGKLPVTAMAGFIGNLQLIIFIGILYVVAVDELLDQHLSSYTPRIANLLRMGLLPSYLGLTALSIALIIP